MLDLDCHGQTSLKVAFVMFDLVLMKFRKLKSLNQENKKIDHHNP